MRKNVGIALMVLLGLATFWLGNHVSHDAREGMVPGQPFSAIQAAGKGLSSPRFEVSFHPTDLLVGLVLVVIVGLFMLYQLLGRAQRRGEEHGSARWGRPGDIKPFMNKNPERNLWLTQKVGVSLDRAEKPEHQRNLNVLVVGGSGTGKSRHFVMPNLVRGLSSGLVTDPKGELLAMSGNALKRAGYKIRVLNLVDFAQSDCFNPFCYLRPGHEPEDVALMVRSIISNTSDARRQGGDPFWEKAESALLNALIAFVAATYRPKDQHLGSVIDLLGRMRVTEPGDPPSEVDNLFKAAQDLVGQELLTYAVSQYTIYSQAADKTAASILVTAGVRLAPLHIPAVRRILERDTLELDRVGVEPTMLFVIISDSNKQFSWFASLVFTMFFQRALWLADQRPGGRLEVPVMCWMDEFANIGKIPDFEVLAATIRSRGVSFAAIVQNLSHGKGLYDEVGWKTIMGNCDSTLFLGSSDPDTRKWIAEALGKQTIRVVDHSRNTGGRGGSRQEKTIGRELLSADEVGRLPGGEALVLVRGLRPFRDRKLPPAPAGEPYVHRQPAEQDMLSGGDGCGW